MKIKFGFRFPSSVVRPPFSVNRLPSNGQPRLPFGSRSTVNGILLLLVSAVNLFAGTRTGLPSASRIWDVKWLDINRWRCPIYNFGMFGIDKKAGDVAGGYWPYPLKNFYIFGAGLWVGSIRAGKDTFVTCGYNPNSGTGEFFPTAYKDWEAGSGNPLDRVYKYPDWPPPQSRFGTDTILVPQNTFSLQDMWCVYTDADILTHFSPGQPLGIEVYQLVYAWNYPTNQDIFFLIYRVKNVSADTLKNTILGVVMDADVGDYRDDMFGMIKERVFSFLPNDTVRNLGFIGDDNNIESPGSLWQSGTPGVVAYKFLESPRRPDGTQLGMTACKKFTIEIDPVKDVDQYLTLAGVSYRTGIYEPYDSLLDIAPADKRYIQCSGPFDLPPDKYETIIVAVLAAPFGGPGATWASRWEPENETTFIHLAKVAQTAQFIYNQGWLLPGPPEAPNVTLVPGDNSVRITWDNLSEIIPDKYFRVASDTTKRGAGYDSLYKEFDFEGYKVYKSVDGQNWTLLTQCDLVNGDTFQVWTQPESIRTKATDKGIFYSLTDNNVFNGFAYYYAVTAYDFNFVTGRDALGNPKKDTLILEAGIRAVPVVPRWNPANQVPAQVKVVKLVGDTLLSGIICSTKVSVPHNVISDTFELSFLGPVYAGRSDLVKFQYYLKQLKTGRQFLIDSISRGYELALYKDAKTYRVPFVFSSIPDSGALEGSFAIRFGIPTTGFTELLIKKGNFPKDTVSFARNTPGLWTFRGSDYQVVWQKSGDKITVQVTDITNNLPVPYITYSMTTEESLNGFAFVDRRFRRSSDSLLPGHKFLYICGATVQLQKGVDSIGSLRDLINSGDTWLIIGNTTEKSAPYYNRFLIITEPLSFDTVTKKTLGVRVVPNPYLVTNPWEPNLNDRRIAFTNLPGECEIRIFNLAGDLVKLIKHKPTKTTPFDQGGTETWNLLNRNDQFVASGVYIFHIKSSIGEQTGKFAIIR